MLHTAKNQAQALNVVVIGGTRGLGVSLVRKFHSNGHRVLFTSRSQSNIQQVLDSTHSHNLSSIPLIGVKNDLSTIDGVSELMHIVKNQMHSGIDVWINNAALSDGNTPFLLQPSEYIEQIIATNITGNLLALRLVIEAMLSQPGMGHVFNVIGAGSNGWATPDFSTYGCTKAAIAQFTKTMQYELKDSNIGIHTISPGMMPTNLLSENASDVKKRMFNVVCENPDVVAAHVYNRIIAIVANKEKRSAIKYLTWARIAYHIMTFYSRRNRFFTTH